MNDLLLPGAPTAPKIIASNFSNVGRASSGEILSVSLIVVKTPVEIVEVEVELVKTRSEFVQDYYASLDNFWSDTVRWNRYNLVSRTIVDLSGRRNYGKYGVGGDSK